MFPARLRILSFLAVLGGVSAFPRILIAEMEDLYGPPGTTNFGKEVKILPNGNFVVADPNYTRPGTNIQTGGVFLHDRDGALISTLTGSHANDSVGSGGITVLANGNFVVASYLWDNDTITNAGAVTWGSMTTGVNGVISEENSLVGRRPQDFAEFSIPFPITNGIVALSNGNYVVSAPAADAGSLRDAGAVIWGDGVKGVRGVISEANSLMGTTADAYVGDGGVTEVGSGNYVVCSPHWKNGASVQVGAVTWCPGNTGLTGPVTVSNSLVGSLARDMVGGGSPRDRRIVVLSDGNYVVNSPLWNFGTTFGNPYAGAVTWCSGKTGRTGLISGSNSLIGTTPYFARPRSETDYPAIEVVTVLKAGNYVVSSPLWDRAGQENAGAVTWCAAGGLTTGVVSEANSVTGSHIGAEVGRVVALSSGDYVIAAERWSTAERWIPGAVTNAGAVRLMSGSGPSSGTLTAENSLVGTQKDDRVGAGGITALANGNFVVSSPAWSKGSDAGTGAVTWVNGATGLTGPVTSGNSLTGHRGGALLGGTAYATASNETAYLSTVTALTNGHYVVASPSWDNAQGGVGAVTWGNGSTGLTGTVTAANSIIGARHGDSVGGGVDSQRRYIRPGGVTALLDGNYLIGSPFWSNGAVSGAGALTWASGSGPTSAVVSSGNSLVGSVERQLLGAVPPTPLQDGGFVLLNPEWISPAHHANGAVYAWSGGSSPAGPTGQLSIGNCVSSNFGLTGAGNLRYSLDPAGGRLVAASPVDNRITFITPGTPNTPEMTLRQGNGSVVAAGGTVELPAAAPGATRVVNLIFGNSGYGSLTLTAVSSTDPQFKVLLPAGGVTLMRGESLRIPLIFTALQPGNQSAVIQLFSNNPETPALTFTAAVSVSADSTALTTDIPGPPGSAAFGNQVYCLPNGNLVITDPGYDEPGSPKDLGAVYLYSPSGTQISRLTGSTAFDRVGSGGVVVLPNGHYVILSNHWQNQETSPVAVTGAVTWGSAVSGVSGMVSSANSLVGGSAGDDVGGFSALNGNPGVTALPNGNYLVSSPRWNNAAGDSARTGAVTWGNGLTGVTGVVSESNSIVGYGVGGLSPAGENGVTVLSNGNCVASSTRAVTWISGASGAAGQISEANSLFTSADQTGVIPVRALTDGNYAAAWPGFDFGKGAVAWGDGASGSRGAVNVGNALVGEEVPDNVGSGGITALPGGKYAVLSPHWATRSGAVTWGSAGGGTRGLISAENSLVGDQYGNSVGSGGLVVLANGNVVISSPDWTSWPVWTGIPNSWRGAVTLCHHENPVTGSPSGENSLVGCQSGPGGVTALDDGNFVVCDPQWNQSQGAVIWCSGQAGRQGPVTVENSLTGLSPQQGLGAAAKVFALRSGGYVIACPDWKNAAGVTVGAVMRMTGSTEGAGSLHAANALTGSSEGDELGSGGVQPLSNGHFLILSPGWSARRGAVTWADGFAPLAGNVSAANSLVGTTAIRYVNGFPRDFIGDLIGGGSNGAYGGSVRTLANGNYLVLSPFWSNGETAQAGAVTFGDGQRGIAGEVSAANSIVGDTYFDHLGADGFSVWRDSAWALSCPEFKHPPGTSSAPGVLIPGDGRHLPSAYGPPNRDSSVAAGAGEHAGPAVSSDYDSTARRWVVGRPNDNMVTLFSWGSPALRRLSMELPGGIDLPGGSTVDFGWLDPGQSAERIVTLVNTGGDPLHLGAITFGGTAFGLRTAPAQATLPPNGKTDLTLRFTPLSPGLQTAVMHLASDDPDRPSVILNLRGGANAPASKPFGEEPAAPEITVLADGKTSLRFHGLPGITYRLERSPDLSNWSFSCLLTGDASGTVTFVDDSPRTFSAFYRLKAR